MVFDFDTVVDRTGSGSIKWAAAGPGQLALGLADMDFRTAPSIIAALERRVEHGVFGYTSAGDGFYAAVTGWMQARRSLTVEADWILPTGGVMQSMAHVLRATLQPSDGVIVQTPAFGPIPAIVEANGLAVVANPLIYSDGTYAMDLAAFRVAVEAPQVRAFVLCSPHNPIGRVWSRQELEAVAELCAANGVIVISDEIHAEIVYPWAEFVTYAAVAPPSSRFAVLFGPSKGFNLPGMRTSITMIPDEGLRAAVGAELVRVNEDFGVNVLGSVAVEAAYRSGGDWIDAVTDYLTGNVEALAGGLGHSVPGIQLIRPDASFLAWLDCRGLGLEDNELHRRLRERAGVIVESGTSFGSEGSGFVRINMGTPRSRLLEAVDRIATTLG